MTFISVFSCSSSLSLSACLASEPIVEFSFRSVLKKLYASSSFHFSTNSELLACLILDRERLGPAADGLQLDRVRPRGMELSLLPGKFLEANGEEE
ncbi:hypothetical protein BpHYR1_023225 [Brachionus plicatilis]|uniref:Secreted protein n=1 Tax=Brachionus plicatilis TaxID=10195 RepID=A0A3M7ST67_BRAPC|nr:hypothetical protein BpHYR1_023225 [Brachionus plicatilis]